jgi:glycosyltransferase involved in cell wall biosynthesis
MDIYALQLIRHLQQHDQENEYFVFVKKGPDACLRESDRLHIVEVKGVTYLDWEQVWLPKAVRRYRLDMLHCTSNTAPLFIDVPLCVTLHDIIYLDAAFAGGSRYQQMGHYYRRWVVPSAFRRAAKVITVSAFEKKKIAKRLGTVHKLKVTYNGVGKQFTASPAGRNKLDNLPENFLFFLGNTAPKKNMSGLIRAYAHYCADVADVRPLVIAESSEEDLRAILQPLGLLHLRPKIHLTGYVAHERLPELYRRASCFLYPSLRESFGIPIIEAMASGTPVITSHCTAMPEIAGNAALLVPPRDSKAIAAAIRQLQQDPELAAELREKGLARAQQFTWQQTAMATQRIYEQTIRENVKTSYAVQTAQ